MKLTKVSRFTFRAKREHPQGALFWECHMPQTDSTQSAQQKPTQKHQRTAGKGLT